MSKQSPATSKVEAVIKTSLKTAFLRKLKGKSQNSVITELIRKYVKG